MGSRSKYGSLISVKWVTMSHTKEIDVGWIADGNMRIEIIALDEESIKLHLIYFKELEIFNVYNIVYL